MRTFALGLSVLLVSAGALAFAIGGGGGGDNDPAEPPPPANTEFAGVLLRIGLGADTLAAAGITSEQVPALVAAVARNHSAVTLQSRDEVYISARQTHDRLRRLVQSGKGSSEDVFALREAETVLISAKNGKENYLADLGRQALATVSSEQAALVTRIQVNGSWSLPTQYLVKDRSEAEWVALRAALASKRISEQDEEEVLSQAARDALSAADAVSEVATARVNLDSRIAAVQTAWNLAASD